MKAVEKQGIGVGMVLEDSGMKANEISNEVRYIKMVKAHLVLQISVTRVSKRNIRFWLRCDANNFECAMRRMWCSKMTHGKRFRGGMMLNRLVNVRCMSVLEKQCCYYGHSGIRRRV